jgi:hypothetical protein
MVTMTLAEALEYLKKNPPLPLALSDDEIDYSDIPALTDEELKELRPLYPHLRGKGRPRLSVLPRKLISIKLDPFLVERLKREAKAKNTKYQSLIHQILENYFKKAEWN